MDSSDPHGAICAKLNRNIWISYLTHASLQIDFGKKLHRASKTLTKFKEMWSKPSILGKKTLPKPSFKQALDISTKTFGLGNLEGKKPKNI